MLLALMRQINVAIIGGGTVGGGVYKALRQNGRLLASRLGVQLSVTRVVVRDLRKPRAVSIPKGKLTTDWKSVVEDERNHIIVELVGGVTLARQMVRKALRAGKLVVTANKALLSEHGEELFELARVELLARSLLQLLYLPQLLLDRSFVRTRRRVCSV